MIEFAIRRMEPEDAEGAAALQALAFPPPFRPDFHFDADDFRLLLTAFPDGQLVATDRNHGIVGSCCNTIISEDLWGGHKGWWETAGGMSLKTYDAGGTTLYGLDIAVEPGLRVQGIGRRFYEARYTYVRKHRLTRYGTGCRVPDYAARRLVDPQLSADAYIQEVCSGRVWDRTLSPLLRYGLTLRGVIHDYMDDEESGNAAALLEWRP